VFPTFGVVPEPDPFNRAASHLDGAWSILTGMLSPPSAAALTTQVKF
jgi:hypothetical protein